MKSVTFKTASGNDIKLAITTRKESIADHTMMIDCYDLDLLINDDLQTGGATKIVMHAQYGACLKHGKKMIVIPSNKIDDVKNLLDEYVTTVNHRIAQTVKTERAYESHQNALYKMMHHHADTL